MTVVTGFSEFDSSGAAYGVRVSCMKTVHPLSEMYTKLTTTFGETNTLSLNLIVDMFIERWSTVMGTVVIVSRLLVEVRRGVSYISLRILLGSKHRTNKNM